MSKIESTIKDVYAPRNVFRPEHEVGLEVEMEGKGLANFRVPGWITSGDGSLRGNGVEWILEHPLSKTDALHSLDYLYRVAKREGTLKPSDRCGVHIHINCQHMTVPEVFNYITLYLILEDLILSWCGEDREGNLFCLRAKDAEWLIFNLIEDKVKSGRFYKTTSKGEFKYAAINVAAIKYYGSLEFRALRTPKTPKPIKNYVSLLLRLKEKAIGVKDATAFIVACSERGEVEWAKDILGPYFNMLSCRNMDEVIMDGVRRTQALAFSPLKKAVRKKNRPEEDRLIFAGPAPMLRAGDVNPAQNWRLADGRLVMGNREVPDDAPEVAEDQPEPPPAPPPIQPNWGQILGEEEERIRARAERERRRNRH